jgi:Spy/CpxP family protein refolding chaperone
MSKSGGIGGGRKPAGEEAGGPSRGGKRFRIRRETSCPDIEERKRTMTRKREWVVLTVALTLAVGAVPLQAQRGGGVGGRAAGPHAGRSLDILLENQEALGLTDAQLAQIQDMKTTMDTEVAPLAEELRTLRDQIRAGEVDRDKGFRQLQGLRGELMTASAPLRGRLQEILTVEQHRALQAEVWQSRPGMGRGMGFRGPGTAGTPGGRLRGGRGGFGPRQGLNSPGLAAGFGVRLGPGRGPLGPASRPNPNLKRGLRWVHPVGGNGKGNLYPMG